MFTEAFRLARQGLSSPLLQPPPGGAVSVAIEKSPDSSLIVILSADIPLYSIADKKENLPGLRTAAKDIIALLQDSRLQVVRLQESWRYTVSKLGPEVSSDLSDDTDFAPILISHPSASQQSKSIRSLELIITTELAKRGAHRYIILSPFKGLYRKLDEYLEAVNNHVEVYNLEDLCRLLDDDGSNTSPQKFPSPGPNDTPQQPVTPNTAETPQESEPPAAIFAYGVGVDSPVNPLAKFFTALGLFLAPLLFKRLSEDTFSSSSQETRILRSKQGTPTLPAPSLSSSSQNHLSASTSQTAPSNTQQSVSFVEGAPLVDYATTSATEPEIDTNPLSDGLITTVPPIAAQVATSPTLGNRAFNGVPPLLREGEGLLLSHNQLAPNGGYSPIASVGSNQQQFLSDLASNLLSSNSSQLRVAIALPNELTFNELENSYYANRWAMAIPPTLSPDTLPPNIPTTITPPLPTGDRPVTIPPTLPPDTLPPSIPTTITPPPSVQPDSRFTAGVFTVGESGAISVDFLFDGGENMGELGIFSLRGLGQYSLQSADFIQEAVRRVTSNSLLGHVVISDVTQGARLSQTLSWEKNVNQGDYLGPQTFAMQPGDPFGFVLLTSGTFQQMQFTPNGGGYPNLLFSVTTTQPDPLFSSNQIADTGIPNIYALEDQSRDKSDNDFNDLIFQLKGATGATVALDSVIAPQFDWRSTSLGQQLQHITQPTPNPQPGSSLSSSLPSQDGLVVPYTQAKEQRSTTQAPVTNGSTITNGSNAINNPWAIDSYSWRNQAPISYPSGDSTSNSLVLNSPKFSDVNSTSGGSHTTPINITPQPCESNSSTLFSGNFEDPFSDIHTKANVISNSDDPFRPAPKRTS